MFSNRKQLKKDRINDYISRLKQSESKISWQSINNEIEVKNHNQVAGLQFADIFATAVRKYAFEKDRFGDVETEYLKILSPFLYKHKEQIENYGLKIRGNYDFHKKTKELLREFNFKVSP